MNIQIVDNVTYHNINHKYRKLKEHDKWKELITVHIDKFYNNKKINHDWINYIVYYEINDKFLIYFRKFFVKSYSKIELISDETVTSLFRNIIKCIKKQDIILPIDYIYDILQDDITLDIHELLSKKNNNNFRLHIKFEIKNDILKFSIKYCNFFECSIKDFNKLQSEIYNKYKVLEKSKKKIIMINNQINKINCEDNLCELQKYMYNNNYWLDIAFNFNMNSFQNNSCFSDYKLYFVKYDIILILNDHKILDFIDTSGIDNKLILFIPIDFSRDSMYGIIRDIIDDEFLNLNEEEYKLFILLYYVRKIIYNNDSTILINGNEFIKEDLKKENKQKNDESMDYTLFKSDTIEVSDFLLLEIIKKKPKNIDDLLDIVGRNFLLYKKYGRLFIDIINSYPSCININNCNIDYTILGISTNNNFITKFNEFLIKETESSSNNNFLEKKLKGRNKKSAFNRFEKNNKIYIGKRFLYNSENIIIWEDYLSGYNITNLTLIYNFLLFNKFIENNKIKKKNIFVKPMPILRISNVCNQNIFNKHDFFKIHNLDTNKKLITIFLRFPKIYVLLDKKEIKKFPEYLFHLNLFLLESDELNLIISSLKDTYNIVFKLHPFYCKTINNNVFLNESYRNNFMGNKISFKGKKYKTIHFFKEYNIISHDYDAEISKYTDFGMFFYTSSSSTPLFINDIPIIEISSRNNDWFLTDGGKKSKNKTILDTFLNKFPSWKNKKSYDNRKYNYGANVYWEDIKNDLKNNLNKILSKDYKKEFKYFNNNPLTGNEYNTTQKDIGKNILEVINKYNFNKITNNIKYNLCKEALTIYQNSYIDVQIEKKIIIIEILKDPFKDGNFISTGVNIYIYNIEPICKLYMEFDVKLDSEEEDVYIRIYTGIKWIEYKNLMLTTKLKKFKFSEEFNLENNSKWRLTTVSRKIGQKITITNFKCNLDNVSN